MELSRLSAFYQVARFGSFSKAAEHLFTAQPALSRQVAALEKELGLKLFSRQARGVVLTEAGRRLLEYAEQVFGLVAEAERVMAELKNLETGRLLLGASVTVGNYLLPPFLAAYGREHHGIEVRLEVKNSREVETMIANRQVDLALLSGPVRVPGLYVEVIVEDELVAVTAADHRLARESDVPLAALAEETLVVQGAGSATREATEHYLAARGITPGKTVELGEPEAVKRGVTSGMGIAFLSRRCMELELQHGLLRPMAGPGWSFVRHFFLAFPKDTRLSPAGLAFLALIRKHRCLKGEDSPVLLPFRSSSEK